MEEVVKVTVYWAVPCTTLPSGFVAIAEITAAPKPTDLAIPVFGSIETTDELLDDQTAALTC